MAETTIIKLSAYIPALLTAGCDIIFSTSTPGNLVAPKNSLFIDTAAASTTTRLWITTDGAGTWAYFTSSA